MRPSYKWWVVAMLWLICFFNYADRQAIFAVFPKLEEEFHFSKEQLGLIGSAFMWVYAGGAMFAGYVCDRVPRKALILGGCLFWSFVTITTGWCSKFKHFVTVRALEGFGETFYFPASMSLTSDYHGPRTRSRALAFHQSSVYAGTILGSWFGAAMAMKYGWRIGFYIFGAVGMLVALLLLRFLREPARGESEQNLTAPAVPTLEKPGLAETFRLIFRSPAVILLMLAFVGANAVATVFLVWTPTFLKEKFGFDLAMAGLIATVFINAASALSVPCAGWAADRLTSRFPGGRILIQALGLIAGAAFVFLVGQTQSRVTLIVCMTIFGLCKGCYDSGIFASLYDTIEPRARGTAAGIMNTVGWGGGAFGPWLVGRIAEHGPHGANKMQNMSYAIAWGSALYVIAAGLLVSAAFVTRRGSKRGAPGLTSGDAPR